MTADEQPVIAATPEPPYYAVIFSSIRTQGDDGYGDMAERMVALAAEQPGYLGFESARESIGITVSYWRDRQSIADWKRNLDHLDAQRSGRERWYERYRVRIALVEREYGFNR